MKQYKNSRSLTPVLMSQPLVCREGVLPTQSRGNGGNCRDEKLIGIVPTVSGDRANRLDNDNKVDGTHPFLR